MKKLWSLLLVVLTFNSWAVDFPTQKEFYADPQNMQRFNETKKSGMLEKSLDMSNEQCVKNAKSEAEKKQCACTFKEMGKMDEKALFYESYISYAIFQAISAAKQTGDSKEEAELKKYRDQRLGLTAQLEKTCGKVEMK